MGKKAKEEGKEVEDDKEEEEEKDDESEEEKEEEKKEEEKKDEEVLEPQPKLEDEPAAELTVEEKAMKFHKKAHDDANPRMLSSNFTKFTLPEESEGFSKVEYLWD